MKGKAVSIRTVLSKNTELLTKGTQELLQTTTVLEFLRTSVNKPSERHSCKLFYPEDQDLLPEEGATRIYLLI